MKNVQSFTLRMQKDQAQKIKHIASFKKRSTNREIEKIICSHIEAFERSHGIIDLPKNQPRNEIQ